MESIDSMLQSCINAIDELASDNDVLEYLTDTQSSKSIKVTRKLYLVYTSFSKQGNIHVIRAADSEGISTYNIPETYRNSLFQNWGVFRKANQSKEVVIHSSFRENLLNRISIILAKAVYDFDGARVGYVVMDLPRETISNVVSRYLDMYHTEIMLINKFNTVVFNSEGTDAEGLGKLSLKENIDTVWASNSMSGFLHEDDYCYSKSSFADYMILCKVSDDVINMSVRFLKESSIFILWIVTVLSLVFAYVISRSISAPIRDLTKSMKEVENGNFLTKVTVKSKDEIGELGRAFNRMTSRIDELIRNVKEKQETLRVLEVNALALQMNPHFLYNTLDLIKWNAKLGKNKEVSEIAVQFGKLLRQIINNRNEFVTVGYELDLISAYVDIQKKRHEQLEVKYELEEGITDKYIPKLMLQPLVENAIVHGMENKIGSGKISISAYRKEGYLIFTVTDDGCGMTEEQLRTVRNLKSEGMYRIGLSNIERRAKMYGDESCGLTINSVEGEGTTIILQLKEIREGDANV
ncbi:MAG TPA: histidine kinase [Clostridiaceae bacterium]|nr:histidine kinase [Clostridiaceae bacterium]